MMQTINVRSFVTVMNWWSYISSRMYLFGLMFCFSFCVPTDLSGFRLRLCIKVIYCLSQMKHQLDATLCRFYFCRVTLHVSGASAHHQEYLKLVRRPLLHVFCKNI